MKRKILYRLIVLVVAIAAMQSCNYTLDVNPNEVVVDSLHYKNVYDVDNSIWGLYGKVADLAENIIVLNELRADLIDVTPNATPDLVAINNFTATEDNKYCDPVKFYAVIANANITLFNLEKMRTEKRISETDFAPRYSDVMAIRTWTYFQLGMHFKQVPYITEPVTDINKFLKDSIAQKLSLDELIPVLIREMENLPTLAVNTLSANYNKTITSNEKSFYLNMQFINKRILLGDLYLWNDQFVQAAQQYKAYMDEDDTGSSKTNVNNKVSGWVWTSSEEPRFQICYQRYRDQNVKAYRNMWKEIFYRGSTDNGVGGTIGLQDEMIWMISYSGASNSESPFIKLFANTGVGEYRLKPSSYVMDSLWNTQVQKSNGFVFDGRGKEASYDLVNGQPVVLKYLYDYYSNFSVDDNKTIHLNYNSISNPYSNAGKWFLYRAALLHLRYAEAANRAGYPKLAYALLNDGIMANYNWMKSDGTYRADKEGVQYTSYPPANDSVPAIPYPEPFYLDARSNNAPYTYLRSPWRDNIGVRGRAYLQNIVTPDYVHDGVDDHNDSIQWIENELIKEAALECGFEGNRWGDLLRVARRQSKNGQGTIPTLMKSTISRKFNASRKGDVNITEENLFLPMKY